MNDPFGDFFDVGAAPAPASSGVSMDDLYSKPIKVMRLPDDLQWQYNLPPIPEEQQQQQQQDEDSSSTRAPFCFLCVYASPAGGMVAHARVNDIQRHIYMYYEKMSLRELCQQVQDMYNEHVRPSLPLVGAHRNEWALSTIAQHIQEHDKSEWMTQMTMCSRFHRQMRHVQQYSLYFEEEDQHGNVLNRGLDQRGVKMQIELFKMWKTTRASLRNMSNSVFANLVNKSHDLSGGNSNNNNSSISSSAGGGGPGRGLKRGWNA